MIQRSHSVPAYHSGECPGFVEREAWPVYVAVLAYTTFITLVVLASEFRFDAAALLLPILCIVVTTACGIHLRRNMGMAQLGSAVQGFALFFSISVAAPLCAVIVASTALPLADDMLAQLDRTLFFGFERVRVVEAIISRPWLFEATKLVYHSLIWQPGALLAILFAMRLRRAWTLLLAWALSLALIISIFPLVPAAGAPPYFLEFLDTFNGARDGSLRLIGREALTGIITFPSFHAAASVLLGWGFCAVPRLKVPFVLLNVLMFASALIAGHYLIDLVAGGLIAWISIAIAEQIQRPARPDPGRTASQPLTAKGVRGTIS